MTGSSAGSAQVGRPLWVSAFFLAAGTCAGSPTETVTGVGRGRLVAAVAVALRAWTARLPTRLDLKGESSRSALVASARRVRASAHRIQKEATTTVARENSWPS